LSKAWDLASEIMQVLQEDRRKKAEELRKTRQREE